MSVGCLRFNTCNSIIKNFNEMPHNSCVDVVKKAVMLVFYTIAMIFALVYDLACDTWHYLCGEKKVEKPKTPEIRENIEPGIWLQFGDTDEMKFFCKEQMFKDSILFALGNRKWSVKKDFTDFVKDLPTNPNRMNHWIICCLLCYDLVTDQNDIKKMILQFDAVNHNSQTYIVDFVIREGQRYENDSAAGACITRIRWLACVARNNMPENGFKDLFEKNRDEFLSLNIRSLTGM